MSQLARLAGVVYIVAALAACDVKLGEDGGVSLNVATGKASDEWKRSYTLPPGARFEVVNTNGLIEAHPAAGAEIEVVARREVRANNDQTAQDLLAKTQMVEDVTPQRIMIGVKTEDAKNNSGFGRRNPVSIQYRLGLPPGLTVALRTENGAVRLENIDGHITANATNGMIIGHGVSGSVDASTVNGAIQMELQSVSADSMLVTVNGPVMLALSRDVKAQLEARAINGAVTVQDGFDLITSERTDRQVVGRINGGGDPRIVVKTTNGGVRVSGPDGIGRGFGPGTRRRDRRPAGG